MSFKNRFLSIFAAAALVVASGSLTLADDKKGVAADLDHYFPIRAALADDTTDGVKEHADHLAKSSDKSVAKAGKALGEAKDVDGARKSFGDLSKALIAALQTAQKKGEKLPEVYIFECPMAKPYGRWLQETKEIANPYMGKKMLQCGKMVASVGVSTGDGAEYTCGMCGVTEKEPGKCPKCGMALRKKPAGGK